MELKKQATVPLTVEGKKMSLDDFTANIFCETANFMKNFFEPKMLRTRGPRPQLADSEVLTIEIVGEILALETDKAIFEFFKRFYHVPDKACADFT